MTYLDDLQSPVEYLDRVGGASQAMIRRWLVIVLSLATILLGRELLWRVGITVSQRTLSAVLSVCLLAALVRLWIYLPLHCPRPGGGGAAAPRRLGILAVWVAWLTFWGLLRDNIVRETLKEALAFLMWVVLSELATYDEVWRVKAAHWFVYLGFIGILLTIRMPGVNTTGDRSTDISIDWIPRNEGTIGFFMRGMATPGLLLCAWGLVQKQTNLWRVLSVSGLIIFFVVDVMLFEFRGDDNDDPMPFLFVFVLLTPIIRGSIPLGTITLLALAGGVTFAIVSHTYAFEHLLTRFGQGQYFRERISEAHAFFSDMGPLDLLVGRGLGGWYEGPYWAPALIYNGHRMWAANHFGFLGFVLRGGFPLLLFMLTFALPIFGPKPRAWYQVDYNLAAVVLTPALLLDMMLNPMIFNADNFFDFLLWSFCLARFCTPPMAAETDADFATRTPTPPTPTTIHTEISSNLE